MISFLHILRAFLSGDGALILPEMELVLFAVGILVVDRWLAANEKHWNAALALGGAAFSAFTLYVQHGKMAALRAANQDSPGLLGFHQGVLVDAFSLFFAALLLAATVLIILLSVRLLENNEEKPGAYYALLLLACAGMMLIASAVDVLAVLLGLQLMALSCYLLLRRAQSETGGEIAQRAYAALWACSSVALVLGFLLLYGNFHTTNLGRMAATLDARLDKGIAFGGLTEWHVVLALSLTAAGAFLLSEAAPLHWFAPGIYECSPVPVAGFLSTAGKVAGFALLLRLFSFVFLFAQQKWIYVWGAVAIVSLLWASVAALGQANVMRLLAYGAVAHTGFILLGLVATNETGFNGMAYYIGSYVFATLGAFGVLLVLQQRGAAVSPLAELDGLSRSSPAAVWLLLIFLLALAGIPPTTGFMARYYMVKALLTAGHPGIAAFAVLCALTSSVYYGRVAAHAFRKPNEAQTPEAAATVPLTFSNGQTVALTAAAFVSLAAGLYPAPFLRMASYVFGQ